MIVYSSPLCQERDRLVHTAALCANVALTFGTDLSKRHLEDTKWVLCI